MLCRRNPTRASDKPPPGNKTRRHAALLLGQAGARGKCNDGELKKKQKTEKRERPWTEDFGAFDVCQTPGIQGVELCFFLLGIVGVVWGGGWWSGSP